MRGGERTIYRITPQGRRRFQKLLREKFQEQGPVAQTIYPALLFLDLAELPAVAEILRERLRQTESALKKTSAIKNQLGSRLGTGNSHLMDHLIQVRRLDCRSLLRLLREVESGKIRAPKRTAIKQLGSLSTGAKQRP